MQATSDLYRELFAQLQAGRRGVRCETRLEIGSGDIIIGESGILSLKTVQRVFSENTPSVGACVSGEIGVEIIPPTSEIPRQAKLVPEVRITDGTQYSEWIQKGVFYIDTRQRIPGASFTSLRLCGYDAILKTEQDYPESTLDWPAADVDVVQEIAASIGVTVDARTLAIMTDGNLIQYPAEYSRREVLGYIASMYAGCFIMSDLGELLLIQLHGIPKETNYLIDHARNAITFGGVRILV